MSGGDSLHTTNSKKSTTTVPDTFEYRPIHTKAFFPPIKAPQPPQILPLQKMALPTP